MTPLTIRLALASVLGSVLVTAPLVHAAAPSRGAPVTSLCKSSSECLRTGEALQRGGRHAEASEAYRQALLALPEPKQRANEGARAAMLAAEARWSAFEVDVDVAHLDAGIEVLEQWLALAGPQCRATLLEDVQRDVALIRAVRNPLAAAETALAEHELEQATAQCKKALDALVHQDHREWSIGAGLVLWVTNELVSAEVQLRVLEQARDVLMAWQGRRPASDSSDRGTAIDERLAELQARIDAAQQAQHDAKLAEHRSETSEPAVEPRKPPTTPNAIRLDQPSQPPSRRPLHVALLSVGIVATAAGAAVLGEGAAFTEVARARARAADAEARAFEQQYGEGFDQASFDAELNAYRAEASRRNVSMIIGGSALAVGGIVTSVVGILALARSHHPSSDQRRARAVVSPVVSTTLRQISGSWRF